MPQVLRNVLGYSLLALAFAACGDDDSPPSSPDAGKATDGGSGGGGAGGKGAAGSSAAGAGAGGKSGAGGRSNAGSPAAGSGGRAAGSGGSSGTGGSGGSGEVEVPPPTESAWADLPTRSLTAVAPPTDPPNASGQTPAFEGQTRAPAPTTLSKINVQTVIEGLSTPWGVAALRDGRFVVTEKAGYMRVVNLEGEKLDPLSGVPDVDESGQGGLLDVAVDEATDPMTLCITYSMPRGGSENSTAASCTTATGDENLTLGTMQMIFQQEPAWQSQQHYGSRFVFAPNDLVYITTGERSQPEPRQLAQDKTKTLGKVVRLKRDGNVPSDNPFASEADEAPKVWSYGHRNIQSAALDSRNRLWTVEHGASGGDELNKPEAGKNYGWPVITYGEDYSGGPIGAGITAMNGMEQPIYYWDPVIAPSGMIVYTGTVFSEWRGDIFVGGLVARALVHLEMKDDRVVSEERFELGARIRDVTQGPDHAIYVLTDEGNGKLLRLTPGE